MVGRLKSQPTRRLKILKFFLQILMIVSSAGTSVFLFTLATFSYLTEIGLKMESFSWVPILSLSLTIFLASIGIVSLPYIFVTELMPQKVSLLSRCVFLIFNHVSGEKCFMHDLHVLSDFVLLHRSQGNLTCPTKYIFNREIFTDFPTNGFDCETVWLHVVFLSSLSFGDGHHNFVHSRNKRQKFDRMLKRRGKFDSDKTGERYI